MSTLAEHDAAMTPEPWHEGLSLRPFTIYDPSDHDLARAWEVRDAKGIVALRNGLPLVVAALEAAKAFTTDDYTWDQETRGDPGPALTAALLALREKGLL